LHRIARHSPVGASPQDCCGAPRPTAVAESNEDRALGPGYFRPRPVCRARYRSGGRRHAAKSRNNLWSWRLKPFTFCTKPKRPMLETIKRLGLGVILIALAAGVLLYTDRGARHRAKRGVGALASADKVFRV